MQQDFESKIVDEKYDVYLCPQDWHVDERGTIFHRIYYVYDGYAVYEGDSGKVVLEKGHVYIFPVNRAYSIAHDPHNPFICLWFHITISPVILNSLIDFSVEENSIAGSIIKAIEASVTSRQDTPGMNALIEELLHSLLYTINLKENFIVLKNENLNSVIDYLHSHYMDNLTNETLCSLCGYDKSYFIRLFEKVLGLSPQKYLLNYRMNKAIELIRDNQPITEVAAQVGYSDSKAFCRAFKRARGVPPSEYRKSHYLQP